MTKAKHWTNDRQSIIPMILRAFEMIAEDAKAAGTAPETWIEYTVNLAKELLPQSELERSEYMKNFASVVERARKEQNMEVKFAGLTRKGNVIVLESGEDYFGEEPTEAERKARDAEDEARLRENGPAF